MTGLVAWALLWYAAGMVGHSVMEVLTRAFYAQHDTRTPVIIGAIAMGLNVTFSFTFASLFEKIGWLPMELGIGELPCYGIGGHSLIYYHAQTAERHK